MIRGGLLVLSAVACILAVPAEGASFAAACFTIHGRLFVANGAPSVRIWRIGTSRVLGVRDCSGVIFEGPGVVPPNVHAVWRNGDSDVYGDFTVCPFQLERPGVMQPVCIKSAGNLVAEKRR